MTRAYETHSHTPAYADAHGNKGKAHEPWRHTAAERVGDVAADASAQIAVYGVLVLGNLKTRAVLFGSIARLLNFWKLPKEAADRSSDSSSLLFGLAVPEVDFFIVQGIPHTAPDPMTPYSER